MTSGSAPRRRGRASLLRQLVTAHIAVVVFACGVLVLAALSVGALLLRANQDDTLRAVAQELCNGIFAERTEGLSLPAAAGDYFKEAQLGGFRFELLDAGGALLVSQGEVAGWDPAAYRLLVDGRPEVPPAAGASSHPREFRTCTRWCQPGFAVRVVTADVLHHHEVRRAALGLLAALPFAALAGVLLGRALFRRSLLPLSELERAAVRAEAAPGATLQVETGARELAGLQSAFNGLLDRLGEALSRERRFSQEASHELRSPLAVLRVRLERLSADAAGGGNAAQELAAALQDVDALTRLVDELLLLARSESAPLPHTPVNLCDLARDAARERALADAPGACAAEVDAPDEVLVRGSEELLARALGNLLENARHAAGADGRIRVSIAAEAHDAVLTVADDGPGIPAGERERVFERFYRGPHERRDRPGAGLGLAVVRATVLRHGGSVAVVPSELGGAAFRVRLPLLAPAAAPGTTAPAVSAAPAPGS